MLCYFSLGMYIVSIPDELKVNKCQGMTSFAYSHLDDKYSTINYYEFLTSALFNLSQ